MAIRKTIPCDARIIGVADHAVASKLYTPAEKSRPTSLADDSAAPRQTSNWQAKHPARSGDFVTDANWPVTRGLKHADKGASYATHTQHTARIG